MEAKHNQLQRRLQQAQKMESIGQLTGGIAHDFNNILASVLGYATLAYNNLEQGDVQQAQYLQEVIKAGEWARGLVKKMLAFSRSEPAILYPLHCTRWSKTASGCCTPFAQYHYHRAAQAGREHPAGHGRRGPVAPGADQPLYQRRDAMDGEET